jgi:hypothetical protein
MADGEEVKPMTHQSYDAINVPTSIEVKKFSRFLIFRA